jgi:hypothetical protein
MLLQWLLALSAVAWAGPLDRLIDDLRSPDPVVRQTAARAIGDLGEWGAPAVPALVAAASVRGARTDTLAIKAARLQGRIEAVRALGRIGPAARNSFDFLFHLATKMNNEGEMAREGSAALAQLGPCIGPDLLPYLSSRKRIQRLSAADTLARIGVETQAVLETLTPLLNHRDKILALDAAEILGRMGTDALPALPALLQTLRHLERYEIRPVREANDMWKAMEDREFLVGVADVLRRIAPDNADVRATLRRLEHTFRAARMAGAAEEVAHQRQALEAERQLVALLSRLLTPADWKDAHVEPVAEILERMDPDRRLLYLANIAEEDQAPADFLSSLVQAFAHRENAVILDEMRKIPRCARFLLPP